MPRKKLIYPEHLCPCGRTTTNKFYCDLCLHPMRRTLIVPRPGRLITAEPDRSHFPSRRRESINELRSKS